MAPIYELSRVTRLYGSRRVVNIEALEIHPGEILAVVGPSGAGKSTLLRLLNFLEAPDGGIVRFHQQAMDYFHVPLQIQRSVTTVFQNPALLTASVVANLQFGLRLRGLKDGRKEVSQILDQLGLTHLKQAPADTLSGGEAQRVALARALVLNPEVLLLDEPTANLDPYNVELIESVIRELNSSHQVTMVLVTHNVFQARRLADRVALMLNGEIIEIADTQTFFEKPQDGRTHAFTRGEMVW
ncbi:MAG TPA: phosphate ABC transporter ATP-binding protein [Bellilinea sp.]|nr:phosphate ABC transporter ATP-binding protein [Bellilinea sp.]